MFSNTDWLNRSLGLPPVEYQVTARPEGGSDVVGRARILGRQMRWRELPFEWLEPEFYRVHRIFDKGPFREARLGVELHEQPGPRSHAVFYSELEPRNALGSWLARRILGPKATRNMRRIVAHVEEFLRGRAKVVLPNLPVQPVHEASLQTGLAKLRETGQPADAVQKLEDLLRHSPDVELTHIRSLAIARRWSMDSWEVLRLFLHATRCGLLELRWEILCPNCRSSRQPPITSLRELKRTSHCDVCQIAFDAAFDQSVELKFAVNPAVRRREEQTFCLAGPGGRPHILSQLWLEPREQRPWRLPRTASRLRLRSPQVKAAMTLPAADESDSRQHLEITCEPAKFLVRTEPSEPSPGGLPQPNARMLNPNPFPVVVSVERIDWSEDIVTAARVTNWQEFRDLFSRQVISPAEQLSVGAQLILFTDLRGSTAMYQGMGDAPAYAVVRNHFGVLADIIRAHHGTLVKTIGDAVMAAFSRAEEALGAVRQMHEQLAARELPPALSLKSSLHVGPCLAVNANDKLDFFGSTVNLAARMISCCQGGDLAVSDELYQRSETKQFLAGCPNPAEPAKVRFRGFAAPQKVWRIELVAPPPARSQAPSTEPHT